MIADRILLMDFKKKYVGTVAGGLYYCVFNDSRVMTVMITEN